MFRLFLFTAFFFLVLQDCAGQAARKKLSAVAYLMEKPYLQTDRSYFYPNETIWIKGYINYVVPARRDSMSAVMCIDIMNKSKQVVLRRLFPIANGQVIASIQLPPGITPGNYLLRGYTRWSLNFHDDFVFKKPFKVLRNHDAARTISPSQVKLRSDKAIITTNKESYNLREKITVEIRTEYSTSSILSVAVTELDQAVPADNEGNIIDSYRFLMNTLPDSMPTKTPLLIQSGIDFKGVLKVKDQPVAGTVIVDEDGKQKGFTITTAGDGHFQQSLQLFDSTDLYYRGKTLKGKEADVTLENDPPFTAPSADFEPLHVDIYNAGEASRFIGQTPGARILDEVEVKAKKIEQSQFKSSIYGIADYTVTGDWMRDHSVQDVIMGLQMKVPGIRRTPLRVNYQGQPLVLVDGVPINDTFQDVTDALESVPVQTIDHVDVLKFSNATIYGARGAGGVIAVYTKKGGGTNDELTPSQKAVMKHVKVMGYSIRQTFESPDYSDPKTDANRFDYRSTIYWDPMVTSDGQKPAMVTLYAADIPGRYRVVVEGVTSDNKPVRAEKIIEIKSK